MSSKRGSTLIFGAVAAGFLFGGSLYAAPRKEPPTRFIELKEGWQVQSGCGLHADGDVISKPQFKPVDWLSATVPSTVLAVELAAGKVADPYYGFNLRKLAGMDYPIGENFSNLPMSQDSPYHCGWWYRKQFDIPVAERGHTLWLHFGGINYRANIWLNGKRIADSKQVAGAYRTYDLNITAEVQPGKSNVLAVETFAPTPEDLGVNWVDWNPCPPDKNMGLWGPVSLTASGAVTVRSPMVTTHLTEASGEQADLTVVAELHNLTDHRVHGVAISTLAGMHLQQQVDLKAGEDKTLTFDADHYPELHMHHPQLWWPYGMGTPHLESASIAFEQDGSVSDEQSVKFGIREITSELTDKGARLFRINGKPLLVRGAGWSQDMLLRDDPERIDKEFLLVKDMHLNTIRLEGKMETDHFFRRADEEGILVMLGWCCCDQWERWDRWSPETLEVATASLRSQLLRLRHHASAMVWLNGSDGPPPANVEQAYLAVEAETHWPNPTLSSASQAPTTVTGKSGVKMTGPYDYVAPSYWLADTGKYGGAYGFNTETGPGPAIPTVSSLHRFLPTASLWPPDEVWSLHYGGEGFKKLEVFDTAMGATYGPAKDLVDYTLVAQTMAYDGERAMFEAYGRNKYTSTGVIQWMLNNAWPSMIWHLYDYYLDTGGGYFGAKKACEPLHVQYSYDDHSIFVVNSLYQPAQHLTASATVFDISLKRLYKNSSELDVGADASVRAFTIPAGTFDANSQVYFVQLALKDQAGDTVSRNFYWLPTKPTEFDWSKTDYTHTPALRHEDLTGLRTLLGSQVDAEADVAGKSIRVQLHNPSKALAFQVAVNAVRSDGKDITPVLWSDNYIELMPGETRTLSATLPEAVANKASVVISGWNIHSQTLPLGRRQAVAQR